ncbi:MAG: sensor histidine kinase, partial [Spirulinaceae cyanobacterium]
VSEESHVALAQVLANTIWQDQADFLTTTTTLSDAELASHPRINQLQQDVLRQLDGLSVVKVKIYDLEGRTVFSTEYAQIGDEKYDSPGFITAKSGQVTSEVGHRDAFQALQTTIADRELLSTYLPIRTAEAGEEVLGVFELYSDVTPLIKGVDRAQRNVVLGSILILGLLYLVLLLFMRRAETLLNSQYEQLQASEGRYKAQATELEQTLAQLNRTQAQMLQNEKMSSLGQLVAGIAHEVNNPISFIQGNLTPVRTYAQDLLELVGLYQRHYPDADPTLQTRAEAIDLDFIREDLPKLVSSMQTGSDRIRAIVQSLRNFARLDETGRKTIDLHEGLNNALIILNHRLKFTADRPAIQVHKDYGVLPPVDCYPGLLNQVLMNILVNGIDAIDQRDATEPGHLRIHTTQTHDDWVKIAIANNGAAIPPEHQGRIFDPFFTTKPVGSGTGMGLSISYQIVVEKHGGRLTCHSASGQDTEFVIELPIQQENSPEVSNQHDSSPLPLSPGDRLATHYCSPNLPDKYSQKKMFQK